jgi:septal ring factor EnvC (AmiA/AmiB activator)
MKLKIILVAILLSISSIAFTQSRVSCEDLLRRALNSLQETTIKLEENDKIIAALEKENSDLLSAIGKENEDLIKENAELKEKLNEASEALEETNEVLEMAKDRIQKDQEEIKKLRNKLEESFLLLEDQKTFSIGGGIMYPVGGKVLFTINIPKIPLSLFTSIMIPIDPFSMHFSLGISYRF